MHAEELTVGLRVCHVLPFPMSIRLGGSILRYVRLGALFSLSNALSSSRCSSSLLLWGITSGFFSSKLLTLILMSVRSGSRLVFLLSTAAYLSKQGETYFQITRYHLGNLIWSG